MNIGQGDDAQTVTMSGEDYISFDPVWKDCMLKISDGFPMPDTYLLGIPFLQTYYAIHDLDNHKIGLAKINKSMLEKKKYSGAAANLQKESN